MNKSVIVIVLLLIAQLCAQPRVVVFWVVDQFAAYYLRTLDGYLGFGINNLLKNGVVYTNAFYPHGVLETAVGHTSLGTGTTPDKHAIVANSWLDMYNIEHALTFDQADEIVVNSFAQIFLTANHHNQSIALSLKDRAAFGMVGAGVPIIWFSHDSGTFVTNRPTFIINNILAQANAKLMHPYQTSWQLAYTNAQYYKFPFINNYEYASEPSLFLPSSHAGTATSREKFIRVFCKLPAANQLLLDMARLYIKQTYKHLEKDAALLVCISLSSLDKIGHSYGPFSREVIDMIYHLDKQIGAFMHQLSHIVSPRDTLYIVTADHGVMPIPELIKQSYPQAGRIIISDLIHEVNDYIKKKFHVHTLIRGQKVPHVYLDQKKLKKMSKQKRQLVMQAVYKKLSEYPGISAVYDAQKLLEKQVPVGSMEGLFKNNIYQGRSGDLFLLIAPYTMVSKYPKGTKHYTPYAYNRHVPLILYQPGTIERKIITQQVAPNQVVATLAKLYRIARPDYMLEPLPGI